MITWIIEVGLPRCSGGYQPFSRHPLFDRGVGFGEFVVRSVVNCGCGKPARQSIGDHLAFPAAPGEVTRIPGSMVINPGPISR